MFEWSKFTCGKHAVKLWDGLDLCLNLATLLIIVTPRTPPQRRNVVGSFRIEFGFRFRFEFGRSFGFWLYMLNGAQSTVAAVSTGEVEKVYARNGITGALTVGDIRKLRTPIENVPETGGETWWEDDTV
ncbi:Hypothetical predicted protein [Olea europaea subsp. europaea]|uniref:Uncharacterized protein n=1 Tax=Olea europaea subsp. europaea TaxID=158383 RepID=A0A8S0SCX0_OLEEU|nr:Hypothetical predicted protein [Olea europaea subsp. europaea]